LSDALDQLAEAAGVARRWQDYRGNWRETAPETLRAVLAALDLPAGSPAEIADSRQALVARVGILPPLLTAMVDEPITLPVQGGYDLVFADGARRTGVAEAGALPAIGQAGYHTLEIAGQRTTLAVAPRQAFTVADAAPGLRSGSQPGTRPWALAVQLYSLRRRGDGGLGDFRALQDLIAPAARHGAAGIAISPVHAQFSADPDRFSPYSPSSRIQLNVLHAAIDLPHDPALDAAPLVDWPAAARRRLAALHAAFAAASPETLAALAHFRAAEGDALETHARFEAIHARQFGADPSRWHWRTWPAELRDPDSPAVRQFALVNADEVRLHAYMQFVANQGLEAAQQTARASGMSIGLIADLAVGADSGGSHCWSRQAETLIGLTIGAPPDALGPQGQSWGLAAFSPRGLRDSGYRAFIEMLRHAMRHAGGVRIDHALGLGRLWVVPEGGSAADGAYLAFPLQDLLRLIALESTRHRAIVLGEDLGTIPDGFQDRLGDAGVLGMRVLWFEKQHGLYTDPAAWTKCAAGVTSTHDLPTVAGWWAGGDIAWRSRLGLVGGPEDEAAQTAERAADRAALWAAFEYSGAANGPAPPPDAAADIADAAARHLGHAACDLVILPMEDALAITEQPNLPGTVDVHPNWRRRLPGAAAELLDDARVSIRLAGLNQVRSDGAAPGV
jgi:4-alpha-glucanotransferase